MLFKEVLHLDVDCALVVVNVGEVGRVIVLGESLQFILEIVEKRYKCTSLCDT